MEKIEKLTYYNELFDIYNSLLTEKQNIYFKAYYFLDQTLQEIADTYNVSRNAIYDQINKTISNLQNYENNLKLLEQKNKRLKLWYEYDNTKDLKYVEQLRKLDIKDGK